MSVGVAAVGQRCSRRSSPPDSVRAGLRGSGWVGLARRARLIGFEQVEAVESGCSRFDVRRCADAGAWWRSRRSSAARPVTPTWCCTTGASTPWTPRSRGRRRWRFAASASSPSGHRRTCWRRLAAGARRIDLHGRLVVPGFNDSHVHLITGANELVEVDLRSATERRRSRHAPAGLCRRRNRRAAGFGRLLGPRGLARAVAPDARGHRPGDAGSPGVRLAARRAHGAGQQPRAEAGRASRATHRCPTAARSSRTRPANRRAC